MMEAHSRLRRHDALDDIDDACDGASELVQTLSRRLEHLSACAAALKRQRQQQRGGGTNPARTDRATQAELGFGLAPLPPAPPLPAADNAAAHHPVSSSNGDSGGASSSSSSSGAWLPTTAAAVAAAATATTTTQPAFFEYRRPFRRIDWRRLHAVNPQALAGSGAGAGAIMSTFADAAYGDVTGAGAGAWLAEGDLLKLVEVFQLQLQYLHWRAAQADAARAAVEARAAALARAFAALPSIGGLGGGSGDGDGDGGSDGGNGGGQGQGQGSGGLLGAVRAVEREAAALGTVSSINALLDEARKAERGLAAAVAGDTHTAR